MAIQIGSANQGVRTDNAVFLAPMSGVSDAPFRRLARRFGAGLVFTEMVASAQTVRAHAETLKKSDIADEEGPLAVQLAGTNPEIVGEAARIQQDRGARLIDLNMGCPVKKVVKTYAGSALMRDEDLALRIIEAAVGAVSVPVTLKMRLGWDETSKNAPSLARKAADAGIQMITVHGRTRMQMYTGTADWQAIAAVKQAVAVPVIANGDILDAADARTAMAASGADGVMIGRGCYGRPWQPGRVAEALGAGAAQARDLTLAERHAVMVEHFDALLSYYGQRRGLRTARKHLAWGVYGLPGANTFRDVVNTSEDPTAVLRALADLFATAGDRDGHPAATLAA